MAIDVCSEISSLSISPRISFSHDLNQTNLLLLEDQDHHDGHRLDSNSDFDFCIVNDNDFTFEFSSADELFSDGKILPVQIKTKECRPKLPDLPELPSKSTVDNSSGTNPEKKKIQLKEILSSGFDSDEDEDEDEEKTRRSSSNNNNYKSFWQFRRSSSLNFDKIKSLHFMSRSNSTGSVPNNPKPPAGHKPSLRKQPSVNSSSTPMANYYKRTSSFSSGANYSYSYGNSHNSNNAVSSKYFPRKNNSCGSQYYHGNNGVRVSPVLNLPQPYISKVTVSFFGFGSLFCNGKLRKKKK